MPLTSSSGLPFMKMHGLGNDFVVIDNRSGGHEVSADIVRSMGDRHRGIGFDQLAVLTATDEISLSFYNADGSQSAACGNATRCVARFLMDETGSEHVRLLTDRGALEALSTADGRVAVNMGHPLLDWEDIPLSEAVDTLHLPIDGDPVGTGMGNPHCTFFVDDAETVSLAEIGSQIEHHPLFPERTNVQFATVTGQDKIRMRVWERGTGVTLASGSSSCATAVAAARRGLTGREVRIMLDGGNIDIRWADDGVWMTGPTAHVFDGVWRP